jgi:signal transduction histidine kinase
LSKFPRGPGYRARIIQVEKALHEAEQAKQALEEQLRQSRKLESLGSLAGGLAHDLNNVLGVILALAARAQRGLEPSGPVSVSLDSIVSACERGREVVGDLLRFVRKEPGTHRPVSVNAVVREVAQWLSPDLLKDSRLVLELDESLPVLLGEGGALSHAIMNLCVNALDAMPEGGTLTIRSWLGPKGEVRLGVQDTGAGMPPEVAKRAMEAFFTTKLAGTGLGLPLVAATLKAHGGRVELNSQPGMGTAVLLVFPCLPEPISEPIRLDELKARMAALEALRRRG